MGILSTKRAASLLAVGASAIALGSLPGSASAACTNITGQGATLQTIAQTNVWIPLASCSGNITYRGTGSGTGLAAWRANAVGTPSADSYIATDEAPTPTQINNLRTSAGSPVEVIPVLQAAVAVIVHLPRNCTAIGTPDSLRIDGRALQNAYDTDTATFSDLFPRQLTGSGCGTTLATAFARNSASGTTRIFKKYLDVVSPGNWSGTVDDTTTWPTPSSVSPTSSGGAGQVTNVVATNNSLAYVNLADAQAAGLSHNPSGTAFWVLLPNGSGWADPQFDDGFGTVTSNCAGTNYGGSVPTTTTDTDWTGVIGVNTAATNYPICALSYVVAYSRRYAAITSPARTANEGDTVARYLRYVTNASTGQVLIDGNNYSRLPTTGNIDTTAARGAALVNTF
jgi:ABC-type phosphate transport system substrate-binding protein